MTTIIGIKVANRQEQALHVQNILTEYGHVIKTRLGLNMHSETDCADCGLILLEIIKKEDAQELIDKLSKIKEIEVQTMKF